MIPKVGVVILNWNGGELLYDCVKSSVEQDYDNLVVIVVDNASSDNSVDELKRLFKDVVLIKNERNIGIAGRNIGIKKALDLDCDSVFVTDNDTILNRDLVSLLVQFALSNSKAGMVGASCYELNHGDSAPIVKINPYSLEVQPYRYSEVPSETACIGASLIRGDLFERIGYYNPDYFAYYEDVDFSLRVRKAGFKVYMIPHATYHHQAAYSVKKVVGLRGFVVVRNKLILLKNDFPPSSLLKYISHLPVDIVVNVGLWGMKGQVKQVFMMLIGVVSGLTYLLRGVELTAMKHVVSILLDRQVMLD